MLGKFSFFNSLILTGLFLTVNNPFAQETSFDYTSKVPKYSYPKTLPEQLETLKSDPLMLRFAKSRRELEKDPFFPLYHFVSPERRLNDPNGLCFWKGNWHMFYQAYPPEDPRQHWGHAYSKDLIHWKDLPYAIYPNPERACFSGATLVEENRVIAMYNGTRVGTMVATADGPLLLNWEKLTGKPVIEKYDNTGFPQKYNVNDVNIWKKDGIYYSLSGGRAPVGPGGRNKPQAHLFRSKDLKNWQYVHQFVNDDYFTLLGDDYSCPYFWPIGDRYILPFFSHMSGGQYLLGDYDKKNNKFYTTTHDKFNFGPSGPAGVHAPSATTDGDDVIIVFNMNQGYPTKGWDHLMSLPRRLSIYGKDVLGIEPAGDIESLRYNHVGQRGITLKANKELVLKKVKGKSMEVNAKIDPQNAQMVELLVFRSPNKKEFTSIQIFPQRGYTEGRYYAYEKIVPKTKGPGMKTTTQISSFISLETSHSSVLPDAQSRAPEKAEFMLKDNANIEMRIFIDRSVVEVFINGTQCVAARVYPGLDNSNGISIRAQGSDAELISLDAWQMKSIYE
jgi:beta-fructofuranosidase